MRNEVKSRCISGRTLKLAMFILLMGIMLIGYGGTCGEKNDSGSSGKGNCSYCAGTGNRWHDVPAYASQPCLYCGGDGWK